MKLITAALFAIVADETLRAKVNQLFADVPVADSNGGMTLDMGNGPIVVAHGKPSLADEKAIRQAIRELAPKAKLSRTNDIAQRVNQYNIAENAKDWRQLFGPKEQTEKKGKGKKDTAAEQVTEQTADEPQNEPVAEQQIVNA